MNPELDIGQAEGAFVMGLGYFLLEELMYDKKTGQITNASTWVSNTDVSSKQGAVTWPFDARKTFDEISKEGIHMLLVSSHNSN